MRVLIELRGPHPDPQRLIGACLAQLGAMRVDIEPSMPGQPRFYSVGFELPAATSVRTALEALRQVPEIASARPEPDAEV